MPITIKKKTPAPNVSDVDNAPSTGINGEKETAAPTKDTPEQQNQTGTEHPPAASNSDEADDVVVDFPAMKVGQAPVELTEDAIAEDFANRYQGNLRYDCDLGRWFRWNGQRWSPDRTHIAFHYARHLCRKHRKGDRRLSTRKAAEGVEMMARRDQRLAVISDIWDRDPLLLGTPEGTVDLRTGVLRKANPEDFITSLTSVWPAPEGTPAPAFSKFLMEVTNGDEDLQLFLQQWFGYGLTGCTTEPPRVCRRLQLLRRWSHEQSDKQQVFTRGPLPCGTAGPRS